MVVVLDGSIYSTSEAPRGTAKGAMSLPARQSDLKWSLKKCVDLWFVTWPDESRTVIWCPTWKIGMEYILSIIKRDYK